MEDDKPARRTGAVELEDTGTPLASKVNEKPCLDAAEIEIKLTAPTGV